MAFKLGRDRAVAGLAAARRVGDPVLGVAVDGGDRLVADDKGANVALRLGHVFLDVEDAVVIRAQHFLVLEDGLGRLAVVDLAQQPPPRTDSRLEHDRIAELLDRLQCTLGRIGHQAARLRHAGTRQRAGRLQLVAARVRDARRVDRLDAAVVEDVQAVERPCMADAAFHHHVEIGELVAEARSLRDLKDQLAVVDQLQVHPAPLELFEEQLLLGAHARIQNAYFHLTRPNPLLLQEPAPVRAARC